MKGIILLNVGSPASADRKDVRLFIEEMLSDPLVMNLPKWIRLILVKGIIGPFRQFASAKRYKRIWNQKSKSSPLIYHTQKLAKKLSEDDNCIVEIAMRYGQPTIAEAFKKMAARVDEVSEVIVLPLFPQYTESTYRSAVDAISQNYIDGQFHFPLRIIEPYYSHAAYIDALAESMSPFLKDEFDKLLFSFHSLPVNQIEAAWEKGIEYDYVYQAKETIRLVLNKLDIPQAKTRLAYSSAMFGNWLGPSLEETVETLGKEEPTHIVVISPGFAADNLETLYDIDIEARKIFANNVGMKFTYIPCLNSSDIWVEAIRKIID